MYNKNWARGEMDITRVFGTWIWGSSPYETTKNNEHKIFRKIMYLLQIPKL